MNDLDLLRQYTEEASEEAFAALVQRHLNLVYATALRQVRSAQLAEDVSQTVFLTLAKNARSLRPGTILAAWLYRTTRYAAADALKARRRRAAREQEAYMQSLGNDSDSETVWARLEPLLEEAMGRLNEKERAVIAVHFFENKSLAEAAMLLGIGEWAARKRVERATEKLRLFFMKRGVTIPATAIASAISALQRAQALRRTAGLLPSTAANC